ADGGRLCQRDDVRVRRVLDGKAAVQELVRLDIEASGKAVRVVVLREETPGAEDNQGHAGFSMGAATELLGLDLGDAVNVARGKRPEILVQPGRRLCAARLPGADRLRDHQRGGRGEQEAVVPGFGTGFE